MPDSYDTELFGRHRKQEWYKIGGFRSTVGKITGYFFKDTLMDLSTPDEYKEAETLYGTVYKSGEDFNGFHIKKIKERGDCIGLIIIDKVSGIEGEIKIKKDQLAALRKWR